MAEALEHLFVPVVVRNNVEGREREVLKQFGEPTWANPSARVVEPQGQTSLARLAGDYTRAGLLNAIAKGLEAAEQEVPAWLALHVGSGKTEQASYAMACFWTGEVKLGGVDGVIATRTGWRGGSEVVEVTFDPARISREALTAQADAMHCRRHDGSGTLRPTPEDDKYQIRRTDLRFLPLTPTQATRINARVGRGIEPLLAPRQVALLRLIQSNPKVGWPLALGRAFPAALQAAEAVARQLTSGDG